MKNLQLLLISALVVMLFNTCKKDDPATVPAEKYERV